MLYSAFMPAKTPPEVCGQLVDVGGRPICARVRGAGSPTVVFESGAGSPSIVWRAVEDLLASEVTTVAYDRVGIGWSPPTREPRTVDAMVENLRQLLDALPVALPIVLVAHSAGALYARAFQAAHPEAVAGMVFIDAVDGTTYEHARRELRPHERLLAEAQRRVMPPIMAVADRIGLVSAMARRSAPDPAIAEDPQLVDATRQFWTGRNRLAGTRAESRSLFDNAKVVSHLGPLGDLPIAVVRAGESRGFFSRISNSWSATQQRLASLSTRSEVITADGAGHFVQTERPEVVAEAVRRVVELARTDAASNPSTPS